MITSTGLEKPVFLKNCFKRNFYKFQLSAKLPAQSMNAEGFLIRKWLILTFLEDGQRILGLNVMSIITI